MKALRSFILFFIVALSFNAAAAFRRDPFHFQSTTAPMHNVRHSVWIPLYFAKANLIAAFLAKNFLSDFGQVNYDTRTNQLYLQDDCAHLKKLKKIVARLDQPSAQFSIKAKIINLDRDYQKTLGVIFQTQSTDNTNNNAPSNANPPTQGPGQFTVSLAKLGDATVLNMQLSALEQQGHAKLISNPSLMTLNKKPAVIESGAEVPYQDTSLSGGTSTSFKKAVLRLQVTPQAMPQHHILLHISLNQDKVSALTVQGVPAIETQHLSTEVIVKNNQTLVLGGILETENDQTSTGVPVLKSIPLIGKIFQHHEKVQKQRELLIFITPTQIP